MTVQKLLKVEKFGNVYAYDYEHEYNVFMK
jgi:hypothetical protein